MLFDLGGTLVDERDFGRWIEVARRLSLELEGESLAHAYGEVQVELDRAPPPPDEETGLREFWKRVLAQSSGRPVDAVTAERFLAGLRESTLPQTHPLFSDARRCLEELQARRKRLAIVSNSSSEASARSILHRAGILDFFERIVSSGTERVAKPNPEIFLRALARLGVPAEASLYVGNLEHTDARAARAVGMHSVWLHRDGTGFGDDPPEITSLLEVPLVVRRLDGSATGSARAGPEHR